jgi:hypothetical protein
MTMIMRSQYIIMIMQPLRPILLHQSDPIIDAIQEEEYRLSPDEVWQQHKTQYNTIQYL